MPAFRFYIETLGCPKNQVDSEVLRDKLSRGGLKEASCPEEADYIIVNTCTFIREAKEETIDVVLNLAQNKRPGQRLVMLGCMVQRYGDVLKKELPEVDHFVRFEEIEAFLETLGCRTNGRVYDYLPETYPYAYLKIAEGCQRQCTFCVIPSVRGPLRSFSPDDILKRAEYLVKSGYREIILIAQDITSYGNDLGRGYGLKELLKDMASIDGQFWIRLLYLYPGNLDIALFELISENRKICSYLDIPLQHTEERILRLMGRPGNREGFLKMIKQARDIIEDLYLRTSFIVGFPTETEQEFQALVSFVREVCFDNLGAFQYSHEEGTKAYALSPRVPERVIRNRYELLMQTQAEISKEKLKGYRGKRLKVLVDSSEEGIATGRHQGQAPEIDGMVLINGSEGLRPGDFIDVLIEDSTTYDLMGRPV